MYHLRSLLVSEQLVDLPGGTQRPTEACSFIFISHIRWTTVPSKGVPKSKLNFYLARDYSRNDRVGESYFEAQYEEIYKAKVGRKI